MILQTGFLIGVLVCVVSSFDMPRFNTEPYREKCGNFLLSKVKKHWNVGCPNTLAVISKDQHLIMHLEATGHITSQDYQLNVVCPGTTTPITIPLSMQRTQARSFCELEKMKLSFKHDALKPDFHSYVFTLEDPALSLSNAFKLFIKLYITGTVVSSGQRTKLLSESLQIYSLEPLLQWNTRPTNYHFLTDNAVKFFSKTPYESSTENFPSIDFIDSNFLSAISGAQETFFKHLLEVGGTIDLASSACNTEVSKPILVLNRLANINYGPAGQIYYYLDLATGKLTFSRIGVSNYARSYAIQAGDRISSICIYIGLGNVDVFKFLLQPTTAKYPLTKYVGGLQQNICHKITGVPARTQVMLYSGFSRFAIKCPIICDYDVNIDFFHDGKAFLNVATPGENPQPQVYQNSLVFPEVTEVSHTGEYSCRRGDMTHLFDIKIVTLPRFIGVEDGLLPIFVYAMEGETLTYSCKVFYSGLNIKLAGEVFYMSQEGWKGPLLVDNFNTFLGGSHVIETVIAQADKGFSAMKLQVNKVPSMDSSTQRNFTHRFTCKASVAGADIAALNLQEYSTSTGSNVIYISAPTAKDIIAGKSNNCSIQGCKPLTGATFTYQFSPEYTWYIKDTKVQIEGYFMLDDININEIPIMREKTKTIYNETDYTLTLIIPPITIDDKDLHNELVKRTKLTAVYNFLYKEDYPASLTIDKSRYGTATVADNSDCRSKTLNRCFYSTAFPSYLNDNRLSFLTNKIDFKIDERAPPPATANTGMIVGILVALLIILLAIFLVAFFCMRDKGGQTYLVDSKEREQGRDPEVEVREELFKEYQRPEANETHDNEGGNLDLQSISSIASDDYRDLDRYGEIDLKPFTEDGSFIGDYTTENKRKKATFDEAAKMVEDAKNSAV